MPENNRFTGKTALITGSSQGIGRGIALALAAEGADIVLNYRSNRESANKTADEIQNMGRKVMICQADAAERDQVQQMFTQAVGLNGRLDIVVANAAYSIRSSVVDAVWDDVLKTIRVSQFGVFHTCQFAARQMVNQEVVDQVLPDHRRRVPRRRMLLTTWPKRQLMHWEKQWQLNWRQIESMSTLSILA